MGKIVAIALTVLTLFTIADAQAPGGNIFVGYSYSGGDVFVHSSALQPASHNANLNGWEGSLEGKFLPWIGLVADLSGHYGSQSVAACPPAPVLPPCQIVNRT